LGTNNIDGTGNDLNNTVTGNTGNNILIGLGGNDIIDGKAGADTMQGGLGNDTYTIDNVGDLVTEALNQGTDSVKTTISYVLTDNVEKLTLLGTNNIDGTGNDLNNTLTGNTGNNTLMGLGGVDTIVGGAGNDILVGGTGKDTLTGGLGSDKFGYQTLGDSLLSGYDVIKDFNATTDVFFVATTPTLFTANAGNVTSLTENNIKGILTNNILANNGDTAQFSYGSRTFLAINNSISGFQANADTLIELTTAGLIGSLNLSNFVLS
jgi:Ca2+-binding RTX toxin-like protein